ncbi:MAG: hypothetical protein JWL70_1857, partial [Acidimicrobiia bacterium]|nr:hypothetical protein [Acidimicrobiia bacterium]
PSLLAVSDVLTGTPLAALAVVAAGTVVAVYLLAQEVLHDHGRALLAAALLVVSPLFVFQSATFLPYLFSLLLGTAATALLLSGVRMASTWRLVAAGVVAALAAFARQFDAVLVLSPAVVAVLIEHRRQLKLLLRTSGLRFLAGAVPVLALMLLFNWRVMGGPFRLPFNVTGSADAFGFGNRGVFESSTLPFHFGDGLAGLGQCMLWFITWLPGGVGFVAFMIAGLVHTARRGAGPARWVVGSWLLVIPIGYLFFWGPWAMSYNWKGVQSFGPFYHLPMLVPGVIFAADGAFWLAGWLRRRHLGAVMPVLALGLAVLTLLTIGDKAKYSDRATRDYRAAQRAVRQADLSDAVLFLPLRTEGGFLSVTPFLTNDVSLKQSVLYAQDCGTDADRDLLSRFPGRTGYRFVIVEGSRPPRAGRYEVRPLDGPPSVAPEGCVAP